MSERDLWFAMRSALAVYGKLQRIENPTELGVADLAYVLRRNETKPAHSGWVELKYLDEWPRKSATPVNLRKLKLEQVRFAESWVAAGGAASCLLRVGSSEHLLFDAPTMRALFKRELTREQLRGRSLVTSVGPFPKKWILLCLTPDET